MMNHLSSQTTQVTEKGLLHNGFVSVGFWERPIQETLVEQVVWKKGLNVLEIGYGLGMAANAIQKLRHPAQHIIFEADQIVADRSQKEMAWSDHVLVVQRWQTPGDYLGAMLFDALVFDSDPEIPADLRWEVDDIFEWIKPPLMLLRRHLAKTARFGFIDFSNRISRHDPFIELANHLGATIHEKKCSAIPYSGCQYSETGDSTVVTLRWDF